MSEPKAPKRPSNPRIRAQVYGLAALYVAYLLYQIVKPYLTHDPYDSPTTGEFILGVVVLGGGAVFLALMSWKMYKTPMPEEPEEAEEALPESGEEDEDNQGESED